MANDKDKALFNEIEKVYNNAARHLQLLQEKQTELEKKFGPSSRITQDGHANISMYRILYDKTLDYINFLRELNASMYENLIGAELMRLRSETGLPYANIAKLAGIDPEKWAALDRIDSKVKKIKELVGDTSEFDTFISWMRDGHSGEVERKGLKHISEIIK